MNILVTGASGMIGSHLVNELLVNGYHVVGLDRSTTRIIHDHYEHAIVDLSNKENIAELVRNKKIDRIIHLAALAHARDGKEYSWADYKHLNIDCAKNIFEVAGETPVLFISTVDVFGFTKGIVNPKTPLNPVSNYAKSKMIAESECKKLKHFNIFRFSPVYTTEIKRDIQKRYYLKYPLVAYQIGHGTSYEILNINKAVRVMVDWCTEEVDNTIRIIKDDMNMWTPDYIKTERLNGRAKIVVYCPRFLASLGYCVLKKITGENKYTYLLNKAVNPLRTE